MSQPATENPADQIPAQTDIVVVGGGIQGAGVAQAAAAAGFDVLLVEKTGWASATSSKSSKLIHGGLRYLSQLQLGLVRESLQEREILTRIAPHLVQLNDFYIPIYRETRIRPWKLMAGLSLYALLGGLGESHRFSRTSASAWDNSDGLETNHLRTVFRYRDGQTDDALLTRSVVASARQLGARIACPVAFTSAQRDSDGYRVQLQTGAGPAATRCKVLVNVGGPWSNQIAEKVTPAPPMPSLDLVQGSHLVLDRKLSDKCYYLECPWDGRAIFVLPWKDTTLLGTTETPFKGNPAEVTTLPEEESYLLRVLAHYFPDYARHVAVRSRMAGLRVLPSSEKDPHNRSRDVMISEDFDDAAGYISVCGGKLTGYRATAESVTKTIIKQLGARTIKADTATLPLPDPISL